jgi:rhamnose utilization protein RhaD (predicted bifunctional aldolase and dehydrogenase)
VASFLGREDARQVALSGPLTPDQIVYCKSFPMWLKQPDATVGELAYELGAFHAKRGHYPKTILVPGVGLATAGPDARAARVAQRVYRDAILVMLGADRLGGIHFMSERDRQFIDNWEVENYRRQVSAGG